MFGRFSRESAKKRISNARKSAKKRISNAKKSVSNRAAKTTQKLKNNIDEAKDLVQMVSKIFEKLYTIASDVIRNDDFLSNFNPSQNKDILLLSAKILIGSYTKKPIQELTGNATDFNMELSQEYSHWVEKIYNNKESWKTFINEKKGELISYKEQVHSTEVLAPRYSIVKKDNTLVLTIKGTSTVKDAIIDLLANTKDISLGENNYSAHTGFVGAASLITEEILDVVQSQLDKGDITNIIVNGHSLGGGTAHITGLLLFDKLNKKYLNKESFEKFTIIGYAPGTTFTTNMNEYISKYVKLDVLSIVNQKDMVPRLSIKNGIVLLAILCAIANKVFKKGLKDGTEINMKEEEITEGLEASGVSKMLKAKLLADRVRENKEQIKKQLSSKFKGGGEAKEFWNKIAQIRDKISEKYMSKENLSSINTTIIGKILYFNGEAFSEVEKLNIFTIEKISAKNHLMENYIIALSQDQLKKAAINAGQGALAKDPIQQLKQTQFVPTFGGGKRRKKKRTKRRKSRRKSRRRRKRKTKKRKRGHRGKSPRRRR
jgi:hypothetical protein